MVTTNVPCQVCVSMHPSERETNVIDLVVAYRAVAYRAVSVS